MSPGRAALSGRSALGGRLALGGRIAQGLRSPLPGLRLLVWLYLYLVAVLGAWAIAAMMITPWSPVVVTSGSMAPAIRPGDVVFGAPAEDDVVTQHAIVTFTDADGKRVTHRVFSIEGDQLVITKGDANPTPDAVPVEVRQIESVGRMIVPFVGLPALWWSTGRPLAVAAWLGLTILSAVFVARERTDRVGGSGHGSRAGSTGVAHAAIRQVRVVVALMAVAQFAVDSSRFALSMVQLPPWVTLATTVGVLLGTNWVSGALPAEPGSASSLRGRVRASLARRLHIVELAVDVVLVVGLVTLIGTSGYGWVLFALPIIEAAARYRLVGALNTWLVLTGLTIALQVAIGIRFETPNTVLLDDLDAVVDQLSVLLLVVIPASYLAEQLLTQVLEHRLATSRAESRSRLLQQVVDLGRTVTKLDRSLFETLTSATETLGFDGAEVSVRMSAGDTWHVLSTSDSVRDRPLPAPGEPGGAASDHLLDVESVYVADDDPEADDAAGIAASGWGTLVRMVVPTPDEATIIVRACLEPGRKLDPQAVEGLSLLLGQASVGLQNNRLLDELRSLNERMHHDATHDPLTGLPNRVALLAFLDGAASAAAPGEGLGVFFLDLDGFKPVNDRLGHDAGDELLRQVARRLRSAVAANDLVARLGGDEFTVVVSGLRSRADAAAVAQRLIDTIDQPFSLGADPVSVGTSVGIAYTEAVVDGSELIRRSDVAMYEAKRDSSSRLHHHDPAMDEADHRLARLTVDLDQALVDGSIDVHFQPIVDAVDGALRGVEAFVRWQHPEHGAIPSLEIIRLAEQAGRAADLGSSIVTRSLTQGASLLPFIDPDRFFVAVNLSPTEVRIRSLADRLAESITRAGLRPDQVVVEISEQLVLGPADVAPANLDRLGELGVGLVLDDFGEARTTLGNLRRMPLTGIKLDPSFAASAEIDEDDPIIIRSLVTMARELGLFVVAEGIESPVQRRVMAGAGVDLVQGYLTGRPMPIDELRRLLEGSVNRGVVGKVVGRVVGQGADETVGGGIR